MAFRTREEIEAAPRRHFHSVAQVAEAVRKAIKEPPPEHTRMPGSNYIDYPTGMGKAPSGTTGAAWTVRLPDGRRFYGDRLQLMRWADENLPWEEES